MLNMNKVVGNKLKKLRQTKNMSQEQIAEFLNISQSAYARIEQGESNSWAIHLNKICRVFEIEPVELFKSEVNLRSDKNPISDEKFIINQLSDKIIEQYEARIKELKKVIKDLKRREHKT
jgi:transcriptional regulator with XRE-family HTH domain